MNNADWCLVVFYSLVMTASVLSAYLLGTRWLGLSQDEGNNLTFYALSFVQIIHVFNLYSGRGNLFNNEITQNKYIWWAMLVCLLILVLTYYVPFLRRALSIQPMREQEFYLIAATGAIQLIVVQLARMLGLGNK